MKDKSRDNVEMLCTIAELGSMFSGKGGLNEFLEKVVDCVAEHMRVPVCSIYLYDEASRELTLQATRGLKIPSGKEVRLMIGEGIAGASLKELRPIREEQASANPNFKFFPGIEEENYEAFLAVPIVHGVNRIGVLTVQHHQRGFFEDADSTALRAIASQLAGAIENTKLFLDLSAGRFSEHTLPDLIDGHEEGESYMIRGSSGSSGFAYGRVAYYGMLSPQENLLAAAENGECPLSLEDFEKALNITEEELQKLQLRLEKEALDLQASLIFNAHLLMLRDPAFVERIRQLIKDGQAPSSAVVETVRELAAVFRQSSNPRLREKEQDVNDLGHRLLQNMMPEEIDGGDYSGRIVITGELLPSDLLRISTQNAAGLVVAKGAFTAHVAILARALDIPLVVAADERLYQLSGYEELLIDASQGNVFVNPDETVLEHYENLRAAQAEADADMSAEEQGTEVYLDDGSRARMLANINLISEIPLALDLGAEGIGLYRSEFPYLVRDDFPQEEEQYRIYSLILEKMQGAEVSLRTLDVGGDKMLSYFPNVKEANPFLGLRSIRFSLQYQDVFEQQLRAMLRAGLDTGGNMRIMFPLISSVDDFLMVRKIVGDCMRQLRRDNHDDLFSPALGVMIELPAAVELADELAAAADFLCLGTNDLVQYMLAADRTNPGIAHYYVPWHPAVLRALNKVASAAGRHKKPVSICGELVNQPGLLIFLLGIGLRDFSVDAHEIVHLRRLLRNTKLSEAEELAGKLLRLSTIEEVEEAMRNYSAEER